MRITSGLLRSLREMDVGRVQYLPAGWLEPQVLTLLQMVGVGQWSRAEDVKTGRWSVCRIG